MGTRHGERGCRRRAGSASLTLLAGLLLAIPGAAAEGAPQLLRVALYQALPTLDPHLHNAFPAYNVQWNVYERLLGFDPDGQLVPALATRWEEGAGGRWRFHLRRGVRFHDGRELAAADVVASLERALHHAKSQVSNRLVHVTGVAAPPIAAGEEPVVEIATDGVDPLFLERLATVAIVPRDAPAEIVAPIGTGAYRWIEGSTVGPIVLEAFAGHWRGQPAIGRVAVTIVEDPDERVARLQAGEVDLVAGLQAADLAAVEGRDDLWVDSRIGLKVFFLELDSRQPPLDDPRVREAIDLAIDREEIVARDYRRNARAASQLASPGTFGFDPGLAPTVPDLERARTLLAEAGRESGLELPFLYPANQETTAQLLAAQLARAGVRLELRPRSPSGYYAAVRAERPPSFFAGLGSAILDAQLNYEGKAHSRSDDAAYGRSNYTDFADPELDRLIEAAGSTADRAARGELLRQAVRRFAAARTVLPLVWTMNLYASRRALDWQPRLDGYLDFAEIRFRAAPGAGGSS